MMPLETRFDSCKNKVLKEFWQNIYQFPLYKVTSTDTYVILISDTVMEDHILHLSWKDQKKTRLTCDDQRFPVLIAQLLYMQGLFGSPTPPHISKGEQVRDLFVLFILAIELSLPVRFSSASDYLFGIFKLFFRINTLQV